MIFAIEHVLPNETPSNIFEFFNVSLNANTNVTNSILDLFIEKKI